MANDFSKKAELYTQKLDELAEQASVTSDLDGQNSDMVRDAGSAGTIYLPKMTIDGLGDYSRETGFPTGDISIDWEPYKLRYDRGKAFEVDDMDNAETLEVVTLNMFGKFVRDKVVPEMDAVRLSTYAANAGTTVAANVTAEKDALKAVLAAEAAIEDVASIDGAILYMTSAFKGLLKVAVPWRFSAGEDPDARFETFDGMRVKTVPSSRFKTSFTLGADGFAATKKADADQTHVTGKASTDAVAINFLLVKPEAVCQIKKTEKLRYFAPDVNQDKDAHKWQYRLYHDAWVLSEKKPLIYAHTAAASA